MIRATEKAVFVNATPDRDGQITCKCDELYRRHTIPCALRAAGMIFMCEFLENRCHAENDEWGRGMS